VLALSFGIGIGMIMAILFRRDETPARSADGAPSPAATAFPRRGLLFLGTLVALLIAGTLKLDWLKAATSGRFDCRGPAPAPAQAVLDRWVPVNEAIGAEGLSLQGWRADRPAAGPSAPRPGADWARSTTASTA
jgi:hypothetical protein